MFTFEVNDMTCGHCVSTITKAVLAVDQGAKVTIDLAAHRVQIVPARSDATRLSNAIQQAGYTPMPATSEAPVSKGSTPRGGCCCR